MDIVELPHADRIPIVLGDGAVPSNHDKLYLPIVSGDRGVPSNHNELYLPIVSGDRAVQYKQRRIASNKVTNGPLSIYC